MEQKTKNIRDPSGAENEDATSIQVEEKINPKQRLRWSRKRNQDQHSSDVENKNETSKDETDSSTEYKTRTNEFTDPRKQEQDIQAAQKTRMKPAFTVD